jgi:membrane protease YdiL (CAAX protease family)
MFVAILPEFETNISPVSATITTTNGDIRRISMKQISPGSAMVEYEVSGHFDSIDVTGSVTMQMIAFSNTQLTAYNLNGNPVYGTVEYLLEGGIGTPLVAQDTKMLSWSVKGSSDRMFYNDSGGPFQLTFPVGGSFFYQIGNYNDVTPAGVGVYPTILLEGLTPSLEYLLYMTVFALTGWIGTQVLYEQPIFAPAMATKPLDLDTGVRAAIILAASMATQLISKAALSFSVQEQALYFIFAAVCEEVFFRVLILSVFLKIGDNLQMKITGVIVQAVAFAAIHQNYYNDPGMLLSVFLGGIVLGIFYVWWRDPTANILGHFILNVIAVQNLLVMI